MTTKYKHQLKQLALAVKIAEEFFSDHSIAIDQDRADMIEFGRETLCLAESPEPNFANIRSLRFLVEDFLTYWNEEKGAHVDQFWARLNAVESIYERQNITSIVIDRGRIADESEYEYVIDVISDSSRKVKLGNEEARQLNDLIKAFEEDGK